MPYTYGGVRRLTKREKEEQRKQKILKEFSRTADLYDYDTITFSLAGARHYGFSVYWSICKSGHIGEFSLRGECKTCVQISRSVRDARIRGGEILNLTEEEKTEISYLYLYARKLSRETGTKYHVDHIKPLSAGGAHHPSNLRVIPAADNLKKGSKYNGRIKTYPKKDKLEITKLIQDEQNRKLEAIYQKKYEEAMALHNNKPFLARIFSSKPKKREVK